MKLSTAVLFVSTLIFASCSSSVPMKSGEEGSRTIASSSAERATIEQWKGTNGLKFVYRSEDGLFKGHGTLNFENWATSEKSRWVARLENGEFVTGYTGELEKFNVGKEREELRIVFRNATGQFVTWKAIDDLVDAGFDSWDINGDGKKETVYVMRYDGKFLNWSKAHLEDWANFEEPVLVVRDTKDGNNNGKLLAWIAPERMGNGKIVYRDPESGKFVSANK